MTENVIFALALIAVPVLARWARLNRKGRMILRFISLAGLFVLLGEATRYTAARLLVLSNLVPIMDILTSILALISILIGVIWITIFFIGSMKVK